ncbi:tumor-associated calcium signal transducer 2 [Athene cunicularia]|uniref:Tumor associated calcium signal transducer 2 n=1 Tax=Athene cunicularia TaxID=194338 RepID=A0A663M2R1_ATHCN|nr:tumor-associated calcium signal transducer 2 [Athene cunicularia]
MELLLRLCLALILVGASSALNNCTCATNKWTVCAQGGSGNCTCTLVGSNHKVNCSTLTSKCLLMQAEMVLLKEKHFWGHPWELLDNDGIYNPDCEDSGMFKARQCNHTNTCWCVNTAGVRRTEKGDKSLNCGEVVRTSWIYIELKHKKRPSTFSGSDIANALKHVLESRYQLRSKYIAAIKYNFPFIQIRLNQKQKSRCDVDIADVAYYFEKDIKNNSIFHSNSTLPVSVNGHALDVEELQIYYVDEKPPVFCMRQLLPDVSTMLTVVTLTAGCGIAGLLILRWLRTRKCKKTEMTEMDEIRAPSLQLS